MAEIAFLIIAIALAAVPHCINPLLLLRTRQWLKKLKKQLLCFVQISM